MTDLAPDGLINTSAFNVPVNGANLIGNLPGATALGIGSTGDPRILERPANIGQLQTKYEKLGPVLQQLPGHVVNALMKFDAERVARGAMPLNDQETTNVIQTVISGKPATPQADRSILNIPGNALRDLGTIVKSIPRLPLAIYHEVTDIPNIGKRISEAEAAGMNPIQALAQAPLIRMIPGAYTVGNLAGGTAGLREAVTHPLMSALDVLPAASEVAKIASPAARAAEEARAAGTVLEGASKRPLVNAAFKRVAETGDALEPNRIASAAGKLLDETGTGQRIAEMFDPLKNRVRPFMREIDSQRAQVQGIIDGTVKPTTPDEANLAEIGALGRKHGIPIDQAPALHEAATLDNLDGLTPQQLAYVSDYKVLQSQVEDSKVMQGLVDRFLVDGSAEVYDKGVGNQYKTLKALADRAGIKGFMREQVAKPTLGVDAYTEAIRNVVDHKLFDNTHGTLSTAERGAMKADGYMSRAESTEYLRAAQHSLGRLGFDVTELRRAISAYGSAKGSADDVLRAVDDFDAAKPLASPKIAAQQDKLADLYVKRNKGFTTAKVAKASAKADEFLTKNAPARFRFVIDKAVGEAAAAEAASLGLDKLPPEKFYKIQRDVERTWRELKSQGIDPVFSHSVSPNRIGQVLDPQISVVPNAITSARRLTAERGPVYRNLQVSLTHEATELVTRARSEAFAAHVGDAVGRTADELRQIYRDRGLRIMEKNFGALDEENALQQAINKDWVKFDSVNAGYNWGGPVLKRFMDDQVYIPKATAEALRKVNDAKGLLGGAIDPVTKAFRTSVIGLSIRTQVNNVVGNAIMLAGEQGVSPFRHWQEAWRMAKDPGIIQDPVLAGSLGSHERLFADLDKNAMSSRATGAIEYLKGRTLGRLFNEAQMGKISDATGAVGRLADKSVKFNGLIDNFYRAMSYLDAHDRALAAGATNEAAAKAGLEMTRKVLMDWSGMTPFERSVMKSVIPFYGFTRHALGYVMRYPLDHPLRASIISALGEAEAEDMSDTLGTKFLGSLFFGHPDALGRVKSIDTGAMNPFRDVANTLTLQGFLGATNPVIATILQAAGIDGGQAELYPTLRYDPETGRLTTSHGNPALALLENTIPQSQILTGLLGLNADIRDRLQRDPASALRSLTAAAGIPAPYRSISLDQEQFKAELARERAASDVWKTAVTSGNYTNAMRYPSLRPQVAGVRALTPEQLAALQPPSVADLLDKIRSMTPTSTVGAGDAPGANLGGL